MPWSGQIMGEEFSSHCQCWTMALSTGDLSSILCKRLKCNDKAWQTSPNISSTKNNGMRQYSKLVLRVGSVAGLEVTSWSVVTPYGVSCHCIIQLGKKNPKPTKTRPLKKPVFSKELLADGSWWRKDFDFCSFNSHLSSMCVQKDVIPWWKGNALGHCSPHSHFIFQVSMSHFGSHLQTTADISLKQSGLWLLFPCIACMVL